MSSRVLLLVLSFFLADPRPAQKPANDFMLRANTTVKLRLTQPISSETAEIGATVDLEIAEDVKLEGLLIISQGNKVRGYIAESEPNRFSGAGHLVIHVGSIVTRRGYIIPAHGDLEANAMAGHEAVLEKGAEIVAHTDQDVALDRTLYTE